MASLDMSLDEMIKNRRSSQRGSSNQRGQGRGRRGRGQGLSFRGARTAGAPRRTQLGVNAQPSSFRIAKSFRRVNNIPWKNGLFEDGLRAAGFSGLDTGTKLYVSNLDAAVSNEDIRELFLEIGEVTRYGLLYDKNGNPSGSAEVWFARRSDAVQALKKYNTVQLDGKPMKIEIVGANAAETLPSARVNVVGAANGARRTVVMTSGRRGFPRVGPISVGRGGGQGSRGNLRGGRGRGRGGYAGGRGHGGIAGRGRKKGVEKSADELDKELENYHAESMQT